MCESYINRLVVARPLVMPNVRHVCVLPPLVMPHVRHVHLGLYIVVSLKGRADCIWLFGCYFACTTTMGYAGFKLSFGIIIVLQLLTIIK